MKNWKKIILDNFINLYKKNRRSCNYLHNPNNIKK